MIISHKHRFIFLKTRKTAGSSIEKALYPHLDPETDICTGSRYDGTPRLNVPTTITGHVGINNIAQLCTGNEIGEYRTFAVERSPWEKVVSDYQYHATINGRPMSVEDFRYRINENRQHLVSDWDRYTVGPVVILDRIFHFEQLDTLNPYLSDILGLDFNLNRALGGHRCKQSARPSADLVETCYDERTVETVAAAFAREIKYFHYQRPRGIHA